VTNYGLRPIIDESIPEEIKKLIKWCLDEIPTNRPTFKQIIQYLEKI
jgi:serine/threonine protein kinase